MTTFYEEVEGLIRQHGRRPEEFSWSVVEEPELRGDGLQAVTKTVRVTCVATRKTRPYEIGSRGDWPTKFENDLANGRFDA